MEHSIKLEIEIYKISSHCSHSPDNTVISCCCFAEDTKKFTKMLNAWAQPLFYSLNLLFSDIPVAIAVIIFLNSPLG